MAHASIEAINRGGAVGGNKSENTIPTLSTMPAAGEDAGLYDRLPREKPLKLPLALCVGRAYKAKAR